MGLEPATSSLGKMAFENGPVAIPLPVEISPVTTHQHNTLPTSGSDFSRVHTLPPQKPPRYAPNAPRWSVAAEVTDLEINRIDGATLPPEQKVGGSNPLGRTMFSMVYEPSAQGLVCSCVAECSARSCLRRLFSSLRSSVNIR
jgi:hypothetical protein